MITPIIQWEQQNASEDLIQLLDLVHEEVNGLNDQFQYFCKTRRNFASEIGFSYPVEQSTGPGRPRFYIPEEVIRGLHYVHGVWKEVAKEVRVSYKTILRRRHLYSMAVNNRTGPRITYSEEVTSFQTLST